MADWAVDRAMEILAWDWTAEEVQDVAAALRQARLDALEEAATVAERLEDEWATIWRTGHKCDTHTEGMSDGAGEVATAIRSLKEKQP